MTGETIRQTAERALMLASGTGALRTYFVGNAPCGHFRTDDGTVFFVKAQLLKSQGPLQLGRGWTDFAWVSKDELPEYFKDDSARRLLDQMLSQ
jgi:hypothetical protein